MASYSTKMENQSLRNLLHRLFSAKPVWQVIGYLIVDTVCVGLGMGVPIFCIFFGFGVGWILVKSITLTVTDLQQVFAKVFKYAIITASFTLLGMLLLWGPFASYLFNPAKDLAQTGIPMILYEPRASFIGWIVLMVLISPFLQLLTTLFSAYLTMFAWVKQQGNAQKAV